MPFFSVIIPLYNKEDHIEKTLQSVLNQNFKDFEVIIIDDGSTDNSVKKVKKIKDSRIKLYSQNNCGAAETRNIGVKKANAKFIALIDADDFWYTNHLEEHFKSITMFPMESLFSNAYQLKLSETNLINAIYNTPKKTTPHLIEDYFKASTIHPIAMTSSITFNKVDFLNLGGYNSEILSGQDLDLMIRYGIYKNIVFNPIITCYYDKSVPNSLSKSNHQISKEKLFSSFKEFEVANTSLKHYLILNRYSLAIQCKLASNEVTYKKLLPQIDKTHLNFKQKLILKMPKSIILLMKKVYLIFIKNGIYISSYK
ncbi:glycosyltransferase family 2 protein [Winogradskyella endarachnes]|uniref:Glycosyltransferase n=1 Tax=Winogradskyella endarachnes TaxID=2681965 RepID=A0A6L6UFT0_9FLAO|nr:glycosyltransferase family A protein [Winogradskyella endarachnes]MUU79647.1 glycosyltransferase [Winogradskyella endarachnes]